MADPRDPRRRVGPALSTGAARRAGSARLAATWRARLARWLRPPRQLRPTRAGWLFFGLVFAVGFAALNTGNNLLYLVLSLMLAFLVLSGVLSEAALRGIEVERRLPFELGAGRPARIVLEIANAQRRSWAHAIVVEDFAAAADGRPGLRLGSVFALRVAPGARERRSYRFEPERRGELHLHGFRVTTRFPFGLFAKSLWIERAATLVVYPRLVPAPPPRLREGAVRGGREWRSATADATEVAGLREYASGDPPRRVHWPASWRHGKLLVRDVEGETAGEAEVSLRTRGARPGEPFEREVERAAAQVDAALRRGLRVALRTDESRLAPGAGPVHRARLLGTLALVEPEREAS